MVIRQGQKLGRTQIGEARDGHSVHCDIHKYKESVRNGINDISAKVCEGSRVVLESFHIGVCT
jgi:hypothetical protein